MADDLDNVVRPDFGDPRMVIDRTGGNFCQHYFVVLRHHSRTVICRQCKEAVDPFDMLVTIARRWETVTWEEKKLSELEASIAELKREESNIKGRLRNAHKGAPEPKSVLFFEELMRRVAGINNWSDQHDVAMWTQSFKWLNSEQEAALKGAMVRAQRRIEDNKAKEPRRRRVARVVGKTEGEGNGA